MDKIPRQWTMKVVIQRVSQAKVEVGDQLVSQIGRGLLVLLGVAENDTEQRARNLARKVANLRIMADENGKMNLSIKDVNGEILVVSQFTLIAETKKGNRPSFIKAAKEEKAKKLYELFVREFKNQGIKKVVTGKFGEYMKVSLVNDGPVTILL